MIKNTKDLHIKCINLIASAACNLQCDYCLIAKRDKKLNTQEFYLKTCQAFEDGTYLKNVLAVLKRLEQDPNDIDEMEIWGQEPTTTLPSWTPHMKDWLDAFPNIVNFSFVSNVMLPNWSDIIYNFFVAIDTYTHRDMSVNLQISFDSIGSYLARGGDNEIMLNNVLQLLDKLNQTQLKHIFLNIGAHSVTSMTLVNNILEDDANIKAYMDSIYYFNKEVANKLINRNVNFTPFGIQYQNGFNATAEDGLKFRYAVEKIEMYARQHHDEYARYIPWVDGCLTFPMITSGFSGRHLTARLKPEDLDLDNYITTMLDDDCHWGPAQYGLFCFSLTRQLKIEFDGTHVPCQNYIYDGYFTQNNIELPDDTLEDQFIKYAMEKQSINFLTATDKEIEEIIDYDIRFTQQKAFIPFVSMIISKMIQLAEAGQISRRYLWDKQLLIRHAFIAATNEPCHYNHMNWTGSIFIMSFAEIKFLCNAIIPLIEQDLDAQLKSNPTERFSTTLTPKRISTPVCDSHKGRREDVYR